MEDSYHVVDSSPGAPPPPPPRHVITIITRRKWIIIQVIAVSVLIALALAMLQPRTFEASAWLLLNVPPKSSEKGIATQADAWSQLQDDLSMHFRLIRREELAQQVAAKLRLDLAPGALLSSISVQKLPGTSANLMSLTYTGPDPGLAQKVATAWAQAYEADSLRRTNSTTTAAIEYVRQQIITVERQLRDNEQRIARLEQQFLTSGIGSGGGAAASSLNSLLSALANARVEESALRAQIAQTQTQLASEPQRIQETEEQPTVAARTAQDQLAQLSVKLEQMRMDYYEDSPEITALKEQIRRLEQQLASHSGLTQTLVKTTNNPTRTRAKDELISLRGQLRALEARAGKLQQQVASQRQVASQVPSVNIVYAELGRKVQALAGVHASLLAQLYELQLKQAMAVPAVQMVRSADLPSAPLQPPTRTILGLGLLAGVLLAIVVAVVVDQLDDTFANLAEIDEGLEHRVVGALPPYDDRAGSVLALLDEPRGAFANAVRKLASTVRIELDRSNVHSLLVTSAVRSEGKSIAAASLAVALARAGSKVVLVDGDLHQPRLHQLFDVHNEIGLSHLLVGNATLAEAQRQTSVDNLWLLTAGAIPLAPVDLLSSEAGHRVMLEINASGSVVIWDAPPAAVLADATVIGSMTDRTLFIIGHRTKRTLVRETLRSLQAVGVRVLGVVANQMRQAALAYHYYPPSESRDDETAS